MESVTRSEQVARSISPASEARSIGSRPVSISSVFQPASAMYESASADSDAVFEVLAPIVSAAALSLSRSFPVAPEIASTRDMDFSNPEPTSAAAPTAPTVAVPTAAKAPPATAATFLMSPATSSMADFRSFTASS